MKLAEVLKDNQGPVVSIITLAHESSKDFPLQHTVLYMVTLDPANCSPSGQFIRFEGVGNDIFGWKRVDEIEVHEILGKREGENVVAIEKAA